MLAFSDGIHEDILTFYPDRIQLYRAGIAHAMDTTDGFHVYRVDIRGRDIEIAVNGQTVINAPGAFNFPAHNGRNRVSYGAGRSSSTGEAYWDWLRWRVNRTLRPGEREVPEADHFIVYKEPFEYACFPSLSVEPDSGHLFTSFSVKETPSHHVTPESRTVRMRSVDDGVTWEEISEFPSGLQADRPGPAFTGPDGALIRIGHYGWRWYPNERLPEFEGLYRITPGTDSRGPGPDYFAVLTGGYVERSGDDGATWQRTELPGLHTYVAFSSPWSYTQLPDGSVMRAFMILHGEDQSRQVYAVITQDGVHAQLVHVMGGEPGGALRFTEETLAHVTSQDTIWLLTRVHGEGDLMWQAFSEDGGYSWHAQPTTIAAGQTPPSALIELDDGRLLMICGYRRVPFGIRAYLSEDEGLSWSQDPVYVLRDDGAGTDLGYPRAVKRPDGSILTLYYYQTADRVNHIAGTLFRVPDL